MTKMTEILVFAGMTKMTEIPDYPDKSGVEHMQSGITYFDDNSPYPPLLRGNIYL